MKVKIVDNATEKLLSVLGPAIEQSRDIRVAVAYISARGLSMIDRSLETALRSCAHVEFLVALDAHNTEPAAVKRLLDWSRAELRIALFCYASLDGAGIYHPKLYLFQSDQAATAIIGSSNLTPGGLAKNIEVNAVMEGSTRDEVISDAYATYNRLKFHPARRVPDEEFLDLYEQLFEREKRQRAASKRDKTLRTLRGAFRTAMTRLPQPKATKRDRVGWLELVYDSLPDGEFTTQQIYAYEAQFRDYYPENLHIKDKIRQQLQFLRKLGFIEHLGKALWRKV